MTDAGDARDLQLVGHSDLGGHADGMQVLRHGDACYVGHFGPSGMGTSILDVSDVGNPRLVGQWPSPPGSHTHKVQVADGLLLVNVEQFRGGEPFSAGMAVYRLTDPFAPELIGFFESGGRGVHRIVWTGGRYAYVSAIPDGFDDRMWVVVDLGDPTAPVEAGRWWWPGTRRGDAQPDPSPPGRRYAAHHALLDGDRAYLGYGDAGMVVLDVSDVARPREIATLNWTPGGDTHTCLPLPGRDLVVVTDEATADDCQEPEKRIRVVDVSDERAPLVRAVCPTPRGDFCARGLRFGPHNLHENRPGSYRSSELVFATYFNAGVRAYDLADPDSPIEIAHWLPPTPPGQRAVQLNDLFVDADGYVYVTDRVGGGLSILEPSPALAERMSQAASP